MDEHAETRVDQLKVGDCGERGGRERQSSPSDSKWIAALAANNSRLLVVSLASQVVLPQATSDPWSRYGRGHPLPLVIRHGRQRRLTACGQWHDS
jgi:hypothetical protein